MADDYDLYVDEAGRIARVFDDYATQLEHLAKKAREIANQADDVASTDSYEFWDRYPNVGSGIPGEEEQYDARLLLGNGLASLLAQISDDLARMDGYENMDDAFQKILEFVQSLAKEVK